MPSRYVQNHVVSPSEGMACKDRDLVTEVWFDSFADLGASAQTPFYKSVLQLDEENFVDTASVLKGVVREGDFYGIRPANAAKLFLVLKKRVDSDKASFEAAGHGAIELDVADGQFAGFVRNTLLSPLGGGDVFADHVLEFWFATKADVGDFLSGPLAAMDTAMQGLLDETRSFHLLAEEYTVDRLRAAGKQAA